MKERAPERHTGEIPFPLLLPLHKPRKRRKRHFLPSLRTHLHSFIVVVVPRSAPCPLGRAFIIIIRPAVPQKGCNPNEYRAVKNAFTLAPSHFGVGIEKRNSRGLYMDTPSKRFPSSLKNADQRKLEMERLQVRAAP